MFQPLFAELESLLASVHPLTKFRYRQSHRDFIQRHDGHVWSVHLSYIKHDTEFDVTVDIGIRFDNVEEMLNRDRGHLSDREKKNTFTVGVEMGNLVCGQPKRWNIQSTEDIEPTAAAIGTQVQDIAMPFFSEYSNPRALLSALEQPDFGRLLAPFNLEQTVSVMRELNAA